MKWAEKGKAAVLVGGQFGSEGKGAIAAWLGLNACPDGVDVATTNAGAQAGHTTQFADGRKFVCYHLPTVGVVRPESTIYVNGGSIIDVDQLKREVANILPFAGVYDRFVVHPRASIITAEAKAAAKDIEQSPGIRYGAIQKGVGHTLAGKILRKALIASGEPRLSPFVRVIDLNRALTVGRTVTVEIPQGTGLGLVHGHEYPYTTSRDCWVGAGLNDAGIHPSFLGKTCMVVRSFPIRVGHFFNEMGEKLGDSGPWYPGSVELDWARDFPGVEPERTTVSKRIRRIATWSDEQYATALRLNRPDIVALTFCDYFKTAEVFSRHLHNMVRIECDVLGHSTEHLFSYGPNQEDITASPNRVDAWLETRYNALATQ